MFPVTYERILHVEVKFNLLFKVFEFYHSMKIVFINGVSNCECSARSSTAAVTVDSSENKSAISKVLGNSSTFRGKKL